MADVKQLLVRPFNTKYRNIEFSKNKFEFMNEKSFLNELKLI